MSRRALPPLVRAAATIGVALGVAVLAGGCGGSPGASPGAPATSAQTRAGLALARCMRTNGVPGYPDPSSDGTLVKETPQQLGVGTSQFQAALSACRHLLPHGGQATPAALRQSWSDFRSFAVCMRRHGAPGWPDPTRYPPHPERPTFDLQAAGIDPSAPRFASGIRACLPQLHGTNPQRLGQGAA